MQKYFYILMAKGYKVIGKDSKGNEIKRDVVYYSKPKHVYAKNEDIARIDIHNKLTNRKWTGFRLVGSNSQNNEFKDIENELILKNRMFLGGKSFVPCISFYRRKIEQFALYLHYKDKLNGY